MSRHATAELLSAYADEELEPAERQQVEAHVEACAPCRQRLAGLRRVKSTLRGLAPVVPPPLLAAEVHRQVRREPLSRGLLDHLELHLSRVPLQSTLIVTFATLFALGLIFYLFVASVERYDQRSFSVIVPPPVAPEQVEVLGRSFRRLPEGGWCEQGVSPDDPALQRRTTAEAAGRELLQRLPGVESLITEGGRVILRDGDQLVELVESPPATP